VGVRDTSKLFKTPLLTACVLLIGAFPAASAASAAGKLHHGRKGAGRHSAARTHGRHTKPQLKHDRTRATAPKPVKVHTPKGRERAVEPKAPDAAAVAAASIASVLATPCQNTEITPEASNISSAREAVLCLINRVRAEHSLAPLRTNARLEAAAEDHNAEMLQVDYFAHVAPDGETPVERIKKTGYIESESVGYVIGENLAWGTYTLSTPKSIVEAWVASPGHLANILESRYTETGVGIVPAVPPSLGEGNPGATYAQEFGVILH